MEREDERPETPTRLELVSYAHVLLGEMIKMMRPVEDRELNAALHKAREEAEAALQRTAQSIVKAARGDAA